MPWLPRPLFWRRHPRRWLGHRRSRPSTTINDLIAAFCTKTDGLTYIDTRELTLSADGKPRPELFVAGRLHFSEEGYKLLTEAVRPVKQNDGGREVRALSLKPSNCLLRAG